MLRAFGLLVVGSDYLTRSFFLPCTDFDVSGTSYSVCPTSDFRSDAGSHRWVFRPSSVDTRGTYTVSGTDLQRCVYSVSSSQRHELVVTPPSDQNESGDFTVTFVPETGNTITLEVSYSKCQYFYWLQYRPS